MASMVIISLYGLWIKNFNYPKLLFQPKNRYFLVISPKLLSAGLSTPVSTLKRYYVLYGHHFKIDNKAVVALWFNLFNDEDNKKDDLTTYRPYGQRYKSKKFEEKSTLGIFYKRHREILTSCVSEIFPSF